MMAGNGAMARFADEGSSRANERPTQYGTTGAMTLQSDRGYEAAPQMFVRLTGSHPARPRASSKSRSVAATR